MGITLRKHNNIRPVFVGTLLNIRNILRSCKDGLSAWHTSVVYRIPCSYDLSYVGPTCITIATIIKEHVADFSKSATNSIDSI